MSSLKKRLASNASGDFYVDSTCIDCDTCRWMAPETFDESGEKSRVYRQPQTEAQKKRALMALVACPTASIGTVEKHEMSPVLAAFPDLIEDNVYHCGYHSEDSFGAASYMIIRAEGNVLIDSPRFASQLVRRLEELGGVKTLLLTHGDDVADHQKFRDHFQCERILHEGDIRPSTQGIERRVVGINPVRIDQDLMVIPTPGHTKGSACLLYQDRFLFTGDHLAWNEETGHLYAFRNACWYDWNIQGESMARLLDYRFEWVLPGHGRRYHLPSDQMHEEMTYCMKWMSGRRKD
jgi:glyoxylase-like metal-dependent hydrolase (beta-lactamase superfamily II)/ferredoxin